MGQEPIAVDLGRGRCRTIQNTQECARAIEAQQLRQSAGRARRQNGALQLRLSSGRWLTVANDTTSEWPSWFEYLGYLKSMEHFVLWQQHPEGNSIRLVNASNGKAVSVDDMPIVSPDRRRFLTASLDLESGFNPNRLVVWRLKPDTILQEATFGADDWGADSVVWFSPTAFRFSRMSQSQDGSLHMLSRDTVRFTHGTWSLRL